MAIVKPSIKYSEYYISSKDNINGNTPDYNSSQVILDIYPTLITNKIWLKEIRIPSSAYTYRNVTTYTPDTHEPVTYTPGFVLSVFVDPDEIIYTINISPGNYDSIQLLTIINDELPGGITMSYLNSTGKFTLSSTDVNAVLTLNAYNSAQLVTLRNLGFVGSSSIYTPWGAIGVYQESTPGQIVEAITPAVFIPTSYYYIQSNELGMAGVFTYSFTTTNVYTYVGPPSPDPPYGYLQGLPLENILAVVAYDTASDYKNPQVSEYMFLTDGFINISYLTFNLLDEWGYSVDLNGKTWSFTLCVTAPS